jgi:glycosyltransferase involved in cell wall biosynthesis
MKGTRHIAFVSTMSRCPWGGSEELWSQAALRLRALNWVVDVSVQGWHTDVPELGPLRKTGCTVTGRKSSSLVQRVLWRMRGQLGRAEYAWLEKTEPALVVISQGDFRDGRAWARQCKSRRVPYALISQMVTEIAWPSDEERVELLEAYQGAAAAYFVCPANLELIQTMLACSLPGARIARNPFKVSYDSHLAWPDASQGLRLACVGRLQPSAKGQDVLFKVLNQEKWRRRALSVSLYGDGLSSRGVEALRSSYGLANVTIRGVTDDILGIWRQHHALILPSRFEGLPLVLVEAMLCGRPAIVTNVGGNTELVQEGVSGFIAEAPTAALLDGALERAWSRQKDWPRIGEGAAQRVRSLIPRDPVGEFVGALMKLASLNS